MKPESRGIGCYNYLIIVLLWNLTGISAALLPRCLLNFRAIGKVYTWISRLRDITRSSGKTSVHLVNRGHGVHTPGQICWVCLYADASSVGFCLRESHKEPEYPIAPSVKCWDPESRMPFFIIINNNSSSSSNDNSNDSSNNDNNNSKNHSKSSRISSSITTRMIAQSWRYRRCRSDEVGTGFAGIRAWSSWGTNSELYLWRWWGMSISCVEIVVFWFKIRLNIFPVVQLTVR